MFNAGAVQFYLDKGRKVEYVFGAMVDVARGESCLKDRMFENTPDHDESERKKLESLFEFSV